MNIVYGNIFDRKVDAIVNPVNCVGVMGGGLAKQFALRYPEMLARYKNKCLYEGFPIGELDVHAKNVAPFKAIINFPTKSDYRYPAKIEYIKEGIKTLNKNPWGFESIALPALGCGLGGLSLKDVKPLIESLNSFKIVELVLLP